MFLLIRHHKVLGMSPDLIQLKKKNRKKQTNTNIQNLHTHYYKGIKTNILGLLVCQYELKDADTCPSLAFPVVGARVQFLQCIKRFGCIVELAHLKKKIVIMSNIWTSQ